jgi:muconolactone delta-isomerase
MTMNTPGTPAEVRTAVTPYQARERRRSAKPSRPGDLRGLWRTALALIARCLVYSWRPRS